VTLRPDRDGASTQPGHIIGIFSERGFDVAAADRTALKASMLFADIVQAKLAKGYGSA
jgi:hypothetical protein